MVMQSVVQVRGLQYPCIHWKSLVLSGGDSFESNIVIHLWNNHIIIILYNVIVSVWVIGLETGSYVLDV